MNCLRGEGGLIRFLVKKVLQSTQSVDRKCFSKLIATKCWDKDLNRFSMKSFLRIICKEFIILAFFVKFIMTGQSVHQSFLWSNPILRPKSLKDKTESESFEGNITHSTTVRNLKFYVRLKIWQTKNWLTSSRKEYPKLDKNWIKEAKFYKSTSLSIGNIMMWAKIYQKRKSCGMN